MLTRFLPVHGCALSLSLSLCGCAHPQYTWGSLLFYVVVFAQSAVAIVPVPGVTAMFECRADRLAGPHAAHCRDALLLLQAAFALAMGVLANVDIRGRAMRAVQYTLTVLSAVGVAVMILALAAFGLFAGPFDADQGAVHRAGAFVSPTARAVDVRGFLAVFGVLVFSEMAHTGSSLLVGTFRDRRDARPFVMMALLTTAAVYMVLGSVATLFAGDDVPDVVTLMFLNLPWQGKSAGLAYTYAGVIKFFVLSVPLFTITAAFPLYVAALADNLRAVLPLPQGYEAVISRNLAALPPIVLAFFIGNPRLIASFTGLAGFALMFWVPCILQIASTLRLRALDVAPKVVATRYSQRFTSALPTVYGILVFSVVAFAVCVHALVRDLA